MGEQKLENIVLTENCAKRFQEIAKEKGLSDYRVRVGVQPGGCAGFSYQFDLVSDEEFQNLKKLQQNIKFREMESQGLKLIVDNKSYLFLIGLHLDYGPFQGFKPVNPHSKGSCGCGSSFSVDIPKKDEAL